jgi:hypothetical protein
MGTKKSGGSELQRVPTHIARRHSFLLPQRMQSSPFAHIYALIDACTSSAARIAGFRAERAAERDGAGRRAAAALAANSCGALLNFLALITFFSY